VKSKLLTLLIGVSLILALVAVPLMTACAPKVPEVPEVPEVPGVPEVPEAPVVELETFKIAAIFWTDPSLAEFYEGSVIACQLAVNEINAAGGILGGRMVELLTGYDEGFTAETSIASVKKALADGADILVGYQDSTTALPAQAYCREKGVILDTTGPGTSLITVGTYPGFLRSGHVFAPSDRGKARWIEDMGFKSVVHLAVDSKYCIDALEDYRYIWNRPGSPVEEPMRFGFLMVRNQLK